MQQLLAGGALVPGAVPLDAGEQHVGRLVARALAGEADREIEPRLVIVGIGLDLVPQLGEVADAARLVGEFERRLRRHDRLVLGTRRGDLREDVAGVVQISGQDERAGETADGTEVIWVAIEDRRIDRGGRPGIAGAERGFRLGEGVVMSVVQGADQPLEEALDLGLGQGAHEAVDRLAPIEHIDCGNCPHAEPLGDLRVRVDVHRDELDLAGCRLGGPLDGGLQGAAGLAPGRQEMDEDGLARGRGQHIGGKARGRRRNGRRLDAVLGAGRHPSADLRRQVHHVASFPLVPMRARWVGRRRSATSVVRRRLSPPCRRIRRNRHPARHGRTAALDRGPADARGFRVSWRRPPGRARPRSRRG